MLVLTYWLSFIRKRQRLAGFCVKRKVNIHIEIVNLPCEVVAGTLSLVDPRFQILEPCPERPAFIDQIFTPCHK